MIFLTAHKIPIFYYKKKQIIGLYLSINKIVQQLDTLVNINVFIKPTGSQISHRWTVGNRWVGVINSDDVRIGGPDVVGFIGRLLGQEGAKGIEVLVDEVASQWLQFLRMGKTAGSYEEAGV